jgi:hypothetical protein
VKRLLRHARLELQQAQQIETPRGC